MSRDQRTKAKRANFGIIYGITVFGLAERLDISRDEAKQLIDGYFETFPEVQAYMEKAKELAREHGYAETFFHRRRYLPDITSHNATVRNFAERNAINAPIQGSAADIIKIAMVHIYERFRREDIKSKMILQVHDELNFSVLPEEKEQDCNRRNAERLSASGSARCRLRLGRKLAGSTLKANNKTPRLWIISKTRRNILSPLSMNLPNGIN